MILQPIHIIYLVGLLIAILIIYQFMQNTVDLSTSSSESWIQRTLSRFMNVGNNNNVYTGVQLTNNIALSEGIPESPEHHPWENATQAYTRKLNAFLREHRVAGGKWEQYAPNGLRWAETRRYPAQTLDRWMREDIDKLCEETWKQWSGEFFQWDWLRAETCWMRDTNPVSKWKRIGVDGCILDRKHYVVQRIWMMIDVEWNDVFRGEPVQEIDGETYHIGYPTVVQVERRLGVPTPMEVIPSGRDILVTPRVEETRVLDKKVLGAWILDSTLTVGTNPLYRMNGRMPPFASQCVLPGWADSSLESSTPPSKELSKQTPWIEPGDVRNKWILPTDAPQDTPFPCQQIDSWNWDDWGNDIPNAPRNEKTCQWQRYALQPFPVRPLDTPQKAVIPRDQGEYTWLFDPVRGITSFPHGSSK